MARTGKTGIDYFPLDIDFFNDEKIQFVSARFGMKGEAITVRILCKIYRNGYYTEWNDDIALLFAKSVGDGGLHSFVNDVVFELLKRGFFDKNIFEKFSILTSRGIQNRYFEATKRYKYIDVFKEYLLVDVPKTKNVYILEINANINSQNVYINPEREKEKEKEKEKERERERENLSHSISDCEIFEISKLRELSGTSWLETVGMKLSIAPASLDSFYDEFCNIQELTDYSNSINDFRRHFVNWLNIKKSSGKNSKKEGSKVEHNLQVYSEVLNEFLNDG